MTVYRVYISSADKLCIRSCDCDKHDVSQPQFKCVQFVPISLQREKNRTLQFDMLSYRAQYAKKVKSKSDWKQAWGFSSTNQMCSVRAYFASKTGKSNSSVWYYVILLCSICAHSNSERIMSLCCCSQVMSVTEKEGLFSTRSTSVRRSVETVIQLNSKHYRLGCLLHSITALRLQLFVIGFRGM